MSSCLYSHSHYKTVLIINFTVQNVYHHSQIEFIWYVENTTLAQIWIWLSINNMVYILSWYYSPAACLVFANGYCARHRTIKVFLIALTLDNYTFCMKLTTDSILTAWFTDWMKMNC